LKLNVTTARSLPQTDLVVHPKRRISMNQDIISGKWKQMRGQVKQWWGKLTDDDLDRIDGAMDRLAGTLQSGMAGSAKRPSGRSRSTSKSPTPPSGAALADASPE
jgi:uncharacterized protein YjbJ (UPF0337 family)